MSEHFDMMEDGILDVYGEYTGGLYMKRNGYPSHAGIADSKTKSRARFRKNVRKHLHKLGVDKKEFPGKYWINKRYGEEPKKIAELWLEVSE
jgi:hypothetical protein